MSYFLEDIERGLRKVDRPIVVYTHSARVNQTFCVAELLKYSVQQPSHQCLLLLTAENYAHYHLICLKQGIKLEEHIARGNLKIVDLFSRGISYFHEELPLTESLPKVWMDVPGAPPQDKPSDLLLFLQGELKYIDATKTSHVIIDDLLTLHLLFADAYATTEVGPKIHQLLSTLRAVQNSTTQLHIMATQMPSHEDLKTYERTLGYLRMVANCQVQVTPNSSGYSKDFDGQIVVEVREGATTSQTKLIFKLENSTLKTLSALKVS